MDVQKRLHHQVLIFLLVILVINFSGCTSKEKLKHEKLSIEVINIVANEYCSILADAGHKNPYILLINHDNAKDGFNEKDIINCFDEEVIKEVFTDENIIFFEKQFTQESNYFNLISESECIKKQLPKGEVPLSSMGDYRTFFISKILFTEDYKYAIFYISRGASSYLSIYKNIDGKYVSFKNCFKSIT